VSQVIGLASATFLNKYGKVIFFRGGTVGSVICLSFGERLEN
jgi:hypothetical protein